MRLVFVILSILLFFFLEGQAQEVKPKKNRVIVTMGWPTNKTNDALISAWENPTNIKIRYAYDINLISIGGGFSYSTYDILWNEDFYSSKNNTYTELHTFISTGLNLKQDIVYFRPYMNMGFSILNTNVKIMEETNGTPYFGFGMDMDISFWPSFQVGVNVGYDITLKPLNLDTSNINIDLEKIKYNDKSIKTLIVELNLAYCF